MIKMTFQKFVMAMLLSVLACIGLTTASFVPPAPAICGGTCPGANAIGGVIDGTWTCTDGSRKCTTNPGIVNKCTDCIVNEATVDPEDNAVQPKCKCKIEAVPDVSEEP